MHKSGIEEYYAVKDGKKLYYGYTTGTCAAAAAQAAARMLITGKAVDTAVITTPKGITLNLEITQQSSGDGWAECAVKKYSGDDPDVTNGTLVFAKVSWQAEPGVTVDGGVGVGRVTKPGLKQKIGEAAINPVPKAMITSEVERVLDDACPSQGVLVVISVPDGERLAEKTFNPRLGIVGGISILGTSGIVEPMSEAALIESIGLEIRQKRALGLTRLIVTPGNYGSDFLKSLFPGDDLDIVKCSNFVGQTVDMAASAGFEEILFVSHIGKFIKVAGGIMNTHSKEADCRGEIMAANALMAGCSRETALKIMECLTTDEMLNILSAEGKLHETMENVARRVDFYLGCRAKGNIKTGAVIFSNETGILCKTPLGEKWLKELEDK